MNERPSARTRRTAVVIGGSLTGMLAAAALSEFADVTVLERDRLPDGPEPRKGLPQARHGHLLWSGGVQAIQQILPGVSDVIVEAGARRVPVMHGLVSLSPAGPWFTRRPRSHHYILLCSRDLLDAKLREEVLRLPNISVRDQTTVLALEGDARRVTGVRARTSGAEEFLAADLVIDASGRGSRAPSWLKALGLSAVPERTVDSGVTYASRIYRAPVPEYPIVNVQANPRNGGPGKSGVILPIEGDRWLVTLSGTRGGEPTSNEDEFETFARGLRHPVIGELITRAEPLTGVITSHSTANDRRYFEKAERWPEGFAALGDAIATYNPVYGHGMSVAAKSVVAMQHELRVHGFSTPGIAQRIQRAAARPVGTAWDLATGQDIFYPGASDHPPTLTERALARYIDRVVIKSIRSRRVTRALLDVMTMEREPTRLIRPDILLSSVLDPRRAELVEPPLTEAELKAVAGAAH
ncbi:FAD-dependent monooxygenase [Streptomyces sp. SYSU K217416]